MTTWYRQTRIAADQPARSLVWRGDELVDWLGGGHAWRADGTVARTPSVVVAGADAVIADASGRWAAVHARAGTTGVLLHDGDVVRELTRDPYQADAFNFPLCLFGIPDGRTLLAHCPKHYGRVELDDAATGERLSTSRERFDLDFFHSRLTASPSGKRLLSAGWIWQPWDVVQWLDVGPALDDATALDRWANEGDAAHLRFAEESSAVWLNDEIIVVGTSRSVGKTRRQPPSSQLHQFDPAGLGVAIFDAMSATRISSFALDYPPGTMLAAGFNHVVTFFDHPRLLSLESQRVVHEWSDLDSGDVVSSISYERPHPVLALDHQNARFALQTPSGIEIVALDLAALPEG